MKTKGKTKKYVFNYPKLYGNIFKKGGTIMKRKEKLSNKNLLKKNIEATLVHIGTLILDLQRVQEKLKHNLENIEEAITEYEKNG